MNRTVILVGCGAMGEPYLRSADDLGLRVGLVETEGRAVELQGRHPCIVDAETVEEGLVSVEEAWAGAALLLAQRLPVEAVIAFTEPHVLAAALVCEAHGLRGPGVYASALARNKALQRAEYARAGIPQPGFRLLPRLSRAPRPEVEGSPAVVKPLDLAGSAGVEYIAGQAQWDEILNRRGDEGPVLVEEYVPGPEYSWEALVVDGAPVFANLTRKETSGPPEFVELRHEVGWGTRDPALGGKADELGTRVLEVLRMRDGMAHLEFKVSEHGEPLVMECAVRTPGDHITEAVSLAYGTDLYSEQWRIALGEAAMPSRQGAQGAERPPRRGIAVLFLSADREGVLREIDMDGLEGAAGVVRHRARHRPGDRVRPPRSSDERIAFAILEYRDQEELERLTKVVRENTVLRFEEGPAAGR